MESQITCHPCPRNPRTKEQRKRRGPTPGRSSNARFFRDLPFGSSRLYRRLGYLPPVLSVFFPLLLSWCLLLFLRIHICEFRVLLSQVYALESPIVRSELHAWPLDGTLFSAFMRLDCGSCLLYTSD